MNAEDLRLLAHAVIALGTIAGVWRGSRGRKHEMRGELHELRVDLADLRDEVGAVRARLNRMEDARMKANGQLVALRGGSDE